MSPFSRKCEEGDVFIVSTLRIPHGRILAKTRKNSVVPKMVSIRAILAPFRAIFASSDENGANSGDFRHHFVHAGDLSLPAHQKDTKQENHVKFLRQFLKNSPKNAMI